MKKFTVNDAIIAVLKEADRALSAKELHNRIIERQYYQFKTDNPIAIIANALRRHSADHSRSGTKFYKKRDDGTYELLHKSDK